MASSIDNHQISAVFPNALGHSTNPQTHESGEPADEPNQTPRKVKNVLRRLSEQLQPQGSQDIESNILSVKKHSLASSTDNHEFQEIPTHGLAYADSHPSAASIRFIRLEHPSLPKGAIITSHINKGSFGKLRLMYDLDTQQIKALKVFRTQPSSPQRTPLSLTQNRQSKTTHTTHIEGLAHELLMQNQLEMPCRISNVLHLGKGKIAALQDTMYDADLHQLLGWTHQIQHHYRSNLQTKEKSIYAFTDQLTQWVGLSIAHQLKKIHDLGYIHGDIKPDNIFVQAGDIQNQPYRFHLADVGFIHQVSESVDHALGSPMFRAPETLPQSTLQGERIPHHQTADIWSLGHTLLNIMTREPMLTMAMPRQANLPNEHRWGSFLDWREHVLSQLETVSLEQVLQNRDYNYNALFRDPAHVHREMFVFILEHMLNPDHNQRATAQDVVDFFKQQSTQQNMLRALLHIDQNKVGPTQYRRNFIQALATYIHDNNIGQR